MGSHGKQTSRDEGREIEKEIGGSKSSPRQVGSSLKKPRREQKNLAWENYWKVVKMGREERKAQLKDQTRRFTKNQGIQKVYSQVWWWTYEAEIRENEISRIVTHEYLCKINARQRNLAFEVQN